MTLVDVLIFALVSFAGGALGARYGVRQEFLEFQRVISKLLPPPTEKLAIPPLPVAMPGPLITKCPTCRCRCRVTAGTTCQCCAERKSDDIPLPEL
jgi:hypothetical protein